MRVAMRLPLHTSAAAWFVVFGLWGQGGVWGRKMLKAVDGCGHLY